jgi:hypothetical protein
VNLPLLGVRLGPILVVFFGVCVIAGLLAIRAARRRARTTGFGVIREQALYAARRWMLGTALLALLGGASAGLWAMAVHNPQALPTPIPTATPTMIPSPTPRPPTATLTLTPLPTATPTSTPLPPATGTPTPTNAKLPDTLRRLPSIDAATPGVHASLVELTMAAGEEDNRPIQPTTVFTKGTKRVYAFMLFDGMADRVAWSHVWYGEVDGQMREIWGKTELWDYEYSYGRIWRYFDCGVGNFELHIYVGKDLQRKVPFVVQGG